jgi:hypothetical protein
MGGRPIVPNPGALHPWILALPENGGWIRPIIRAFAGIALAVACIMGWTSTCDAGPQGAPSTTSDGTPASHAARPSDWWECHIAG